jgi:hypothetical protein
MKFKAKLLQGGKTATGIEIPQKVIEGLGGSKRPALKVTVNGYTYRTTVGFMDGKSMLPFSGDHREASGIRGGDALDVEVEVDTAPRTVELPKELAARLKKAGVMAAYESSPPSAKKEFVRQVESAKAEDTRERRILKIIETLKKKSK